MKSIEYLRHHRKFQSTPPHGRRRLRGWHPDLVICVSIHASAREATYWLHNSASFFQFQSTPPHGRRRILVLLDFLQSLCFNPRLRTGGDSRAEEFKNKPVKFQSTPPHGRRPGLCLDYIKVTLSFNPRLRTGGDKGFHFKNGFFFDVSIHASAREATWVAITTSPFYSLF
mgnify:FL=1